MRPPAQITLTSVNASKNIPGWVVDRFLGIIGVPLKASNPDSVQDEENRKYPPRVGQHPLFYRAVFRARVKGLNLFSFLFLRVF